MIGFILSVGSYCILTVAYGHQFAKVAQPLDEYLVPSVCLLLFQTTFLSTESNVYCIQHTMRFTTWSTVINVIVSAVAMLSLVPVASASSITGLVFSSPETGDTHYAGENATVIWRLIWYMPKQSGKP